MKKVVIPLSLITIIGLLFLAGTAHAYDGYPAWETIGTDNTLVDDTNDLYLSDSGFSESSEQILSLDLLNVSFSETGDNYTMIIELGGDYSILNASINLYAEITGDQVGSLDNQLSLRTSSDFYVKIFENNGEIDRNMICKSIQHQDIAVITGSMINISFPKDNITSEISSPLGITQWKVLVEAFGDSGGNTYYDILPNFGSGSNGIPGYSLLLVGLISTISLLISVKKIRKK
jgi:hypothetical protein